MRRLFSALSLASLLLIGTSGCDSKKPVKSDPAPVPEFAIGGQIYLYRCYGKNDTNNNPPGLDYRCTTISGHSGRVTFVDTLTGANTAVICDSNGFIVRLDSAVYNVILESASSHPDTLFGLSISSDTLLSLDLDADWIPGGVIEATINYNPATDSLGESRERELLDSLVNLIAYGTLDIAAAQRRIISIEGLEPNLWIRYRLPVIDPLETWKVVEQVYSTRPQQDSVFAPYSCDIYPAATICMD